MDVFRPNLPGQGDGIVRPSDPRLQPTPDYGELGAGLNCASNLTADPVRKPLSNLRLLHLGAMIAGMSVALLVSGAGGLSAVWGKITGAPAPHKNYTASEAALSEKDLDRQKPQKQAEILLERAVARTDGATDQIESRVAGWRGKLVWDAQLGELTTAALNSDDRSVRDSAIEVQLATYGLTKNEANVEALIRQADSPDHQRKVWALWALGLLANRGIESDHVVEILTAHLKVSDRGSDRTSEDARRWAVEGLALVGTTPTIAPLLEAMHNDPSPMVRERAACSLAQSGMLSHEQRLIAVPQLIDYSDDPALDSQTHAWAFQALGDITKQRLPNDSAAWRNWYQNNNLNR
jgi:HEAT repeats